MDPRHIADAVEFAAAVTLPLRGTPDERLAEAQRRAHEASRRVRLAQRIETALQRDHIKLLAWCRARTMLLDRLAPLLEAARLWGMYPFLQDTGPQDLQAWDSRPAALLALTDIGITTFLALVLTRRSELDRLMEETLLRDIEACLAKGGLRLGMTGDELHADTRYTAEKF